MARRLPAAAAAIVVILSCVPPARPPVVDPARTRLDSMLAADREAAREAARAEAAAAAEAAADSAALAAISPPPDWAADDHSPIIRIALSTAARDPAVSATGSWRLHDAATGAVLVRALPGEEWRVQRASQRLRAVRDSRTGSAAAAQIVARPAEPMAFLVINGRRYRGEIAFTPTDSGVLVMNRLPLEQYLRGVVPLEIGDRVLAEREAVAAQAIAARSYTYVRRMASASRPYDLGATVLDQVYGGVDAEKPVSDLAVLQTRGLVLRFGGRIVNTPYHSTCGGTTAAAPEVWRSAGEPYLRRVSDRIPGTDRHYCDVSSRFRWTRTYSGTELSQVLERYLRSYASVPSGRLGAIRDVETDGRTASGRTEALIVATERGRFRVRGNDMRFVLRTSGGEILNSTYFSVRPTIERGSVSRLVITGHGYGHGVGMCQWGAIGRARAGQDFRTILSTYYPGTTVAPAQ
ncbi:MAG TPA: SpoIID/LytB domain-containing protein [Gemmatimonadaceae bacterium]|nr:SpoIID/LytB domain-containing protein [Gemmatimonadaceae bacterium]